MKNKRGFTLAELFVVILGIDAVLFVIVVIVMASGLMTRKSNHNAAVEGAKQWANDMHIVANGIECAGIDSDNDSYISCSVSEKKSDGSTKIYSIECAKYFTLNSGCRLPKFNTHGTNR